MPPGASIPNKPHKQYYTQEYCALYRLCTATRQGGLSPSEASDTCGDLCIIAMRLIMVLYSVWGGGGGGGMFSPSDKKGTFEWRRLTIISQISGFRLIWIVGVPKC